MRVRQDGNGKPAFEGDWVKYWFHENCFDRVQIVWDEKESAFRAKDANGILYMFADRFHPIELIEEDAHHE